MALSSFRSAPCERHLERTQRVWYDQVLHLSTSFLNLTTLQFDWEASFYGNIHEDIPKDFLAPLVNIITLSHYGDAHLYPDITLGCSVTGILHLVNQTPIEWYSKKQATVETATYGSEFIAARTCMEQLIDLRLTLR